MIHDVHTHRLPPNPEEAIVCCRYSDFPLAIQQEATYLSVGIHPWYLTQEDIQLQLEWLNNRLQDQRIIAIGESGLDKCCRTPLDLQLEAFEKQTARSESLHLPMILHVVRAYQEIIACRKNLRACQPWIIHGFRGKKEVASSTKAFTSPSDRNSNRKPCVTYRKTVSYWRQTSLHHLSVKSIRRQPQPVRRP